MNQKAHGFAQAADTTPATGDFRHHARLPDGVLEHPLFCALQDESRRSGEQLEAAMERLRRACCIVQLMQLHAHADDSKTTGNPKMNRLTLMDMLVELLADGDEPFQLPYDALESAAGRALCEALLSNERQRAILDAMSVAADLGSTFDELDAAAQNAWETARADATFESDWRRFCSVIESRGGSVEMTQYGPITFLRVVTPERVPALRQQDRAQHGLTSATETSCAVGKTVPEIAPRARRKKGNVARVAGRV
ncbi:hypothetical protein [Burkholderia anthina]|uniref:hypothetical protein n=1 Tax=Burkholderia anthina TaxID=179879 RepID=UPI001AA04114|nr:hypothetical protein [Burkholderia anthina]QTD95627.1 hypothetical protein J4G50_38985 [Burkholderia anthina]QTD95649.1 hypothetical protein J4G50_39115 [Burkholderia anthina]